MLLSCGQKTLPVMFNNLQVLAAMNNHMSHTARQRSGMKMFRKSEVNVRTGNVTGR